VTWCIIGTAAVKDPALVARACRAFPGHIIVGLDAKDGQVAIKGWAEITEHRVEELAKRFEQDGVSAIVYTDIGRDGMLTGPNVEATQRLAEAIATPVIASGGITNLVDIAALVAVAGRRKPGTAVGAPPPRDGSGAGAIAAGAPLPPMAPGAGGIVGAITGRAIYEGSLDFAAGQRLADGLSQ
jgi:phosphoribosylformimino-5-aminoimidazole carboxamide ribotide isomerase